MDLLSQSTLLVAVSSFCFGVVALSRNSRNKLLISFFVLCCVISVWALSFFLNSVRHDHRIYLLHLFFNVWLSPPALVFISFLSRTESRLSRVLRQYSYFRAKSATVSFGASSRRRITTRDCSVSLPSGVR